MRFNVGEELHSQQMACKPQDKVCKSTMLLDYLKDVIERPPEDEINNMIAPISTRVTLVDQQSNFIKAVVKGEVAKVQMFIQKINAFFNRRLMMIKNAERILQTGQSFSVDRIPELISNTDNFNFV